MTEVVPVTWKQTVKLVREWHRHLPRGLTGNRFAAGLAIDGELVGVACTGTPSRVWLDKRKIVISRVAVKPDVDVRENACSRLYGALCRAAEALGFRQAWTYTLPHEPGTSLVAAGFEYMGETKDEDWDRPSRRRRPGDQPGPKKRWLRRLGRHAERELERAA